MPKKTIVPYCDMDRIRLGSPEDAQRLAQATEKAHGALAGSVNALYGIIEQPWQTEIEPLTREDLLAEAAKRAGPELAHEAWYVTHYDRNGECDALTCWVQYVTPEPTSAQDPSYAPVRAGTSRPYERLPF